MRFEGLGFRVEGSRGEARARVLSIALPRYLVQVLWFNHIHTPSQYKRSTYTYSVEAIGCEAISVALPRYLVQALWFKVQGLAFEVWGLGVSGSGFRV